MYCSNCGEHIQDEKAKFCPNCGNKTFSSVDISHSNENNLNTEVHGENNSIENNGISSNGLNNQTNENTMALNNPGNGNTPPNTNTTPYNIYSARVYHKNKFLAFFLSLFFSLGQFYNGQILKGIIFIILPAILLFVPVVGWLIAFIIRIISAVDAYITASGINKNNGNYFYTFEDVV